MLKYCGRTMMVWFIYRFQAKYSNKYYNIGVDRVQEPAEEAWNLSPNGFGHRTQWSKVSWDTNQKSVYLPQMSGRKGRDTPFEEIVTWR